MCVQCIRTFRDFKTRTNFEHRPKFAGQFASTEIHALYTWIGSIESPDELVPLLRFLSNVDQLKQQQMWASVPTKLQRLIVHQLQVSNNLEGMELSVVQTLPGGGDLRATVIDDDRIGHDAVDNDAVKRGREWYSQMTLSALWRWVKTFTLGDRMRGKQGHPKTCGAGWLTAYVHRQSHLSVICYVQVLKPCGCILGA